MQGGGKKMVKTNPLGALAAAGGALVAVGLLVVMLMVVEARPAAATFPGPNGKIAYAILNSGIYTINPGGGGKTKVTNNNTHDFYPAYSPDGEKIAYTEYSDVAVAIYTINADGAGGKYKVTGGSNPSYSPDGK